MVGEDDQIEVSDDDCDEEIEEDDSLGDEKIEAVAEVEMQQEQNQVLLCSVCFDLQHPG